MGETRGRPPWHAADHPRDLTPFRVASRRGIPRNTRTAGGFVNVEDRTIRILYHAAPGATLAPSGSRLDVTWLDKIRLRALAFGIALVLAVVGAISWLAMPALPVIGFAVATAAFVLHGFGARVNAHACHACGKSLSHLSPGTHGIMCPDCGTVCQYFTGSDDAPIDGSTADPAPHDDLA